MYNRKDLYPSRTDHAVSMFPRLDPVLHTEHGQRRSGPLSEEELAAFERDGFLIYPRFFDEEEIAAFRDELRRIAADPEVARSPGTITEPDSDEVRSVFRIHKDDRSARFSRLAGDPRIVKRMEQLLGSDVYIHQSRINYKPGFTGKGFNWHSDFETWHTEDGMPRMRAVSCSIILTDNYETNGPLMLVPGSHKYFVPCVGRTPEDNYKRSLKVQQFGVPDNDSLARLIEAGGITTATGPAGTMILFECNTLHGSNANMSPYPRSNVFFVYNSVQNTPQAPFAARRPRPEFLSEQTDYTPLAAAG